MLFSARHKLNMLTRGPSGFILYQSCTIPTKQCHRVVDTVTSQALTVLQDPYVSQNKLVVYFTNLYHRTILLPLYYTTFIAAMSAHTHARTHARTHTHLMTRKIN